MKVSGFTIVRNGVNYAYPFKEAILSILPLCDEMIVNVGISDDNTLDTVNSIGNSKIKIIESNWDLSKKFEVLSIETNRALKECTGDWCFYIQADEVLHEKFIPDIKNDLLINLEKEKIERLRFKYKHFY